MRLTRIEIENFKGIGKRQAIDLAPITLLFGPNSAGKSTVLQALHYVREVLERQNPNPDKTIAGGVIDLGGFASLVHRHELDRAIRIKLVGKIDPTEENPHFPINGGNSIKDSRFSTLPLNYRLGPGSERPEDGAIHSVGVEFVVRRNDYGAYVQRIDFELNGLEALVLSASSRGGGTVLSDFNFQHPLFQSSDLESDDADQRNPLREEILELSAEIAAQKEVLSDAEIRVAVSTVSGALPDLFNGLKPSFSEIDFRDYLPQRDRLVGRAQATQALDGVAQERQRREGLEQLLNELVCGPLSLFRDWLSDTRYVGPLRRIPERNYQPSKSTISQLGRGRWADGTAAWDLLYDPLDGADVVDWLNQCVGDDGFIPLGFDFVLEGTVELPASGPIAAAFARGFTTDDFAELQSEFSNAPRRVNLRLRDTQTGVLVEPADIGVGVSQVVPIIVASDPEETCGLVAIEQPELHLHPALQVGLGDLFIMAAMCPELVHDEQPQAFLIETHSEHLLLRLLRRIREQTNDEVPPGKLGLSADKLAVIYVDCPMGDTTFQQLRIDEEGEFLDRWPKGFFEERAEELF